MGTYSQMYVHIVFSPKRRAPLIHPSWEDELYKFITGIVTNKGQKMLAINGIPDHIHIVIGYKPSCCISDLVREIKKSTNTFIKEKKFTRFTFAWQEGFAAFTFSQRSMHRVIKYVLNQKQHHAHCSYPDEFLMFLNENEVEYDSKYLDL
jgi:REP element-mobilizing transposase RayT